MKYHCTKQHHNEDCGAACLSTVAKHYGMLSSVAAVRRIAGLDRAALNSYGMVQAAVKLGFNARSVMASRESFFSGFQLPAVAHVTTEDNRLHYIVLHKITEDEVLIADPAAGLRTIPTEEFFRNWTGILILMEPSVRFTEKVMHESMLDRACDLLLLRRPLVPEL